MRKYEPIWLILKSKGTARLEAAPDMHKTIVQGVRKERSNDTRFRINAQLQGKSHRLLWELDTTGYILTFSLKEINKL